MLKKCYLFYYYFLALITLSLSANFNELKKEFYQKLNNSPKWMLRKITKDLTIIKELGYSFDINPQLHNWFEHNIFLVRYKINNNKLEAILPSAQPVHPESRGRLAEVNSLFDTLLKLIKLPDVDIIISINDSFDGNDIPGVILAPAKNKFKDKNIILIPDFHTLNIHPNLIKQVERGNIKYSWEVKENKAFWIGATTGGYYNLENYNNYPRIKLVKLSFEHPDLINARLHFLTQMDETLKPNLINYLSPEVSIEEHMKYKYQIAVDGNGTSYPRTHWQQFGSSVILKQDSDSIQWYYDCLKPYKHYIPFKNDCSDLIEKIIWCKNNDSEVRKIANNANMFANNNLKLVDNLLYIYLVITEISKNQSR